MSKSVRTYLVKETGSEDRLVKAQNELHVFRHIDPTTTISVPTKDQIIELLTSGTQIENAE